MSDLTKSETEKLKSETNLIKSVTEKLKSMTDLTNSVTDFGRNVTDLIRNVTDLGTSKPEFMKNNGFLTLTVTEGRMGVASKPISMMAKPGSATNLGTNV